jgi:hypothetical protein
MSSLAACRHKTLPLVGPVKCLGVHVPTNHRVNAALASIILHSAAPSRNKTNSGLDLGQSRKMFGTLRTGRPPQATSYMQKCCASQSSKENHHHIGAWNQAVRNTTQRNNGKATPLPAQRSLQQSHPATKSLHSPAGVHQRTRTMDMPQRDSRQCRPPTGTGKLLTSLHLNPSEPPGAAQSPTR